MLSNKSLHFSSAFAISCGTVSVNTGKCLALVVLHRKTGEYLLPKGRKDVNETLEQTAIRETFEETGFPVKLLPVAIPTLATMPTQQRATKISSSVGRALVTEPIAVTQRMTNGILKIIFWYAAQVDSTLKQEKSTQQEGEDFDTVWLPIEKVTKTLSFDDDRQIAAKVVSAIPDLRSKRLSF